MELIVLIVIVALGALVPLLWLAGTLTSIVYSMLHREDMIGKEGVFAFNPRLGLTMADGGDAIDGAAAKSGAAGDGKSRPCNGWRFGDWPPRGDKERKA